MSVLLGTSTSSTATFTSTQRKLHLTSTGKLIAICLVNGEIKYDTSTDNGAMWTGSWTSFFALGTIASFDSYMDGSNNIHIATETLYFNNRLYYTKLTWNGGGGTWTDSGDVLIGAGVTRNYPSITIRSNGDLWTSGNSSGTIYTHYSVDSGATWANGGTIGTSAQMAALIPHSTNIWCVVQGNSKITNFEFTSSWDGGTDIAGSGMTNSNTSLGVGKNTDTDIVVAGRTTNGIKAFVYTGSWDGGTLISNNSNDAYPSVSYVDNEPYVAWSDYDGSQYDISYSRYNGGGWDAQVEITSSADLDSKVTTLVEHASSLMLLFMTGSASPWSIYFSNTDLVISITTDAATSVGNITATVNGNLTGIDSQATVKVWFDYREVGAGVWIETAKATKSSTGTYFVNLSSLDDNTEYEFCARASWSDDSHDITGSTETFKTAALLPLTLEWATIPPYYLEWLAVIRQQITPDLEWATELEPKFCPNLVAFDFMWDSVATGDKDVTVCATGCLFAYAIACTDTGSSGTTTIEIYNNTTLLDTITITADSASYSTLKYYDMSTLLRAYYTLRVKITGAAVAAKNLKVNVYEMTFPFNAEPLFLHNLKDTYLIEGTNKEIFFSNADNWYIEMNQPIKELTYLQVENINGDEVALTYTIENGLFYNSRIKITPYTAYDIKAVELKSIDLCNKGHLFSLSPIFHEHFIYFDDYVYGASKTYDLYIPIDSFRYSFDGGVTWSAWDTPVNDSVIIDFTAAVAGTQNINLQYQRGLDVITEVISFYYVTGTLNCTVDVSNATYATISYTDDVPLDKIEVYDNSTLVQSIRAYDITGMDTLIYDDITETITLNSGTLYLGKGITYSYLGGTYTVLKDLTDEHLFKNVVFAFNTKTLEFEFSELPSNQDNTILEARSDLVYIWKVLYRVDIETSPTPNTVTFISRTDIFDKTKIPFVLDTSKDITITTYDISGRTKTQVFSHTQLQYTKWRLLTVTNALAATVLPGQINTYTTLTYALSTETWEE